MKSIGPGCQTARGLLAWSRNTTAHRLFTGRQRQTLYNCRMTISVWSFSCALITLAWGMQARGQTSGVSAGLPLPDSVNVAAYFNGSTRSTFPYCVCQRDAANSPYRISTMHTSAINATTSSLCFNLEVQQCINGRSRCCGVNLAKFEINAFPACSQSTTITAALSGSSTLHWASWSGVSSGYTSVKISNLGLDSSTTSGQELCLYMTRKLSAGDFCKTPSELCRPLSGALSASGDATCTFAMHSSDHKCCPKGSASALGFSVAIPPPPSVPLQTASDIAFVQLYQPGHVFYDAECALFAAQVSSLYGRVKRAPLNFTCVPNVSVGVLASTVTLTSEVALQTLYSRFQNETFANAIVKAYSLGCNSTLQLLTSNGAFYSYDCSNIPALCCPDSSSSSPVLQAETCQVLVNLTSPHPYNAADCALLSAQVQSQFSNDPTVEWSCKEVGPDGMTVGVSDVDPASSFSFLEKFKEASIVTAILNFWGAACGSFTGSSSCAAGITYDCSNTPSLCC